MSRIVDRLQTTTHLQEKVDLIVRMPFHANVNVAWTTAKPPQFRQQLVLRQVVCDEAASIWGQDDFIRKKLIAIVWALLKPKRQLAITHALLG